MGFGYGVLLVFGLAEVQRLAPPEDLAGMTAVFQAFTYVGLRGAVSVVGAEERRVAEHAAARGRGAGGADDGRDAAERAGRARSEQAVAGPRITETLCRTICKESLQSPTVPCAWELRTRRQGRAAAFTAFATALTGVAAVAEASAATPVRRVAPSRRRGATPRASTPPRSSRPSPCGPARRQPERSPSSRATARPGAEPRATPQTGRADRRRRALPHRQHQQDVLGRRPAPAGRRAPRRPRPERAVLPARPAARRRSSRSPCGSC